MLSACGGQPGDLGLGGCGCAPCCLPLIMLPSDPASGLQTCFNLAAVLGMGFVEDGTVFRGLSRCRYRMYTLWHI